MKRRDFLATGSLAVLAATPAVSSAASSINEHQVKLKRFPLEVLDTLRDYAAQALSDLAAKDATSARVYAAFEKFRKQVVGWTEVSEYAYLRARSAGKC